MLPPRRSLSATTISSTLCFSAASVRLAVVDDLGAAPRLVFVRAGVEADDLGVRIRGAQRVAHRARPAGAEDQDAAARAPAPPECAA
jgi:hypothetical protein